MPTVGGITFGNEVEVTPQSTLKATCEQFAAEDTLLTFPEETKLTVGGQWTPNQNKIGIRTAGSAVTQVGVESGLNEYAVSAPDGQFYMSGFNFDHSTGNNNATGVRARVNGTAVIKNTTMIGGVADAPNAVNGFGLAASTQDSAVLLERCQDVGRGTGYHTGSNGGNGRVAIFTGDANNNGLIHLKNCRVTDSANNAVYASNQGSTGKLHVEGGIYEHSYGSQLRTGGNGTIIEGVYMEVDMENKSQRKWGGGQPGIRWEVKGDSNDASGEIRDVHIYLVSGNPQHGIRLQKSAKDVSIDGAYIYCGTKCEPLRVNGKSGYKYAPPDGFANYNNITVNNLQVTGPAAPKSPVYVGDGR